MPTNTTGHFVISQSGFGWCFCILPSDKASIIQSNLLFSMHPTHTPSKANYMWLWDFSWAQDYPLYYSSSVNGTVAHSINLLKEAELTPHAVALLEKGDWQNFTQLTLPLSSTNLGRVRDVKSSSTSACRLPYSKLGRHQRLFTGASLAKQHPVQCMSPGLQAPTLPDHKRPPWPSTVRLDHVPPAFQTCCSRPNSELISQAPFVSLPTKL